MCLDGYCYYPDDGGGAGGNGGAGGGAGGATGGGAVGGGVGGGVTELTSLSFTAPKEGARTKETTVAVKVEGKPVNATGKAVTYAASLVDGGNAKSGSFTADAGNVYEASLSGLTEGEWKIEASSGSLKSSVKFVVDRTPPSVKLAMEPAPTRVVDGGLSEVDPASGYAQAFRRDEVGELRVLTSETVSIATSQFTGVPTAAVSEKTSCTGACDAGACKCFNVDMAQVTIPDAGFRGELTVGLKNVSDEVGNTAAEATTTFKVTRWKWKKFVVSGATAFFTPAIDTQGRLFLGATTASNSGVVMGLEADGRQNFRVESYGAMTAPAVVGRNVYVATKDKNEGAIRQIDVLSGGTSGADCGGVVESENVFTSHLSVAGLSDAEDRLMAVLFVPKDLKSRLVAARPTVTRGCVGVEVPNVASPKRYTMVVNDGAAYLGNTSNANVSRLLWNGTGWGSATMKGVALFTEGMALFGSTLAGGGGLSEGGVYALSAEFDATTPSKFAPSGVAAEASGPLVMGTASSPVFIYGNGSKLMWVPYVPGASGGFTSASSKEVAASGLVTTSPLAGAGGHVYVVDLSGTVSAYSSDITELQWRLASGAAGISGIVDAPLNIDVARTVDGQKECGKPGTLYASSTGDGSLYAFVVDSKGIDATAPWPRFQHDPRNSGNPAVPLSDFSCP